MAFWRLAFHWKLFFARRRYRLVLFLVVAKLVLVLLLLLRIYTALPDHKLSTKSQRHHPNGKGIQVIVAHYYEEKFSGNSFNLTKDLIHRNEFAPIPGEGENGEAVHLPSILLSRVKALFKINQFNLMASDRIALNRTLPDIRKSECTTIEYDITNLPSTSVIIIFHNEAWSTLLRTVHSVINRSPSQLIKEIILVDDASDRAFLKKPLEEHVRSLPVLVRILRLSSRSGLVRARLEGTAIATGQTLVFLDAHCECTKGWLQPLLARIASNRTSVVSPIIDVINDDTFAYIRSFDIHWGAINWDLHFRWFPVGGDVLKQRIQHITSPFKTPIMAGGLFAIDRQYFNEIGQYDPEMNIWGGENIELSLKVWLCGGTLEIVPCSHVGHVFRDASPYRFPGGVGRVLHANLARVAEVWLDQWKEFFFKLNPEAQKLRYEINVQSRLRLREELNCHDFRWFLDNVWPQHFFPTPSDFFGQIKNQKKKKCIQKPHSSDGLSTGRAIVNTCIYETFKPQLLVFSSQGYIMSDESVCLDVPSPDGKNPIVVFLACSQSPNQQWKHDKNENTLIHQKSSRCLDLSASDGLFLKECSMSLTQKWDLNSIQWQ